MTIHKCQICKVDAEFAAPEPIPINISPLPSPATFRPGDSVRINHPRGLWHGRTFPVLGAWGDYVTVNISPTADGIARMVMPHGVKSAWVERVGQAEARAA